jgi:hypothetical protein
MMEERYRWASDTYGLVLLRGDDGYGLVAACYLYVRGPGSGFVTILEPVHDIGAEVEA